jgi:uncharacterized protein RhaS with RHS repeats
MLHWKEQASYYRARYYDQSAGRFLSKDPIRFRGATNFYSYVLNDPVNYIDPLGFKPCKWYECKGWNWVPGVLPAKCAIWSHVLEGSNLYDR